MALPELKPPEDAMLPPKFENRGQTPSEALAALDVLASEMLVYAPAMLDWVAELRQRIEQHIHENGTSVETTDFVMTALKLLRAQALLIERETFDARAAREALDAFPERLTSAERRAFRRSAVRLSTMQKDLVSRIRQAADDLYAYYDHLMQSPPDPWPPEDRND